MGNLTLTVLINCKSLSPLWTRSVQIILDELLNRLVFFSFSPVPELIRCAMNVLIAQKFI